MTPQEKAEELYKNIYSKIFDIDNGANVEQDAKRAYAAKQCALIAVDEMINQNRKLYLFTYLFDVKSEIEKL